MSPSRIDIRPAVLPLSFGENFSIDPLPLNEPTLESPRILVIGGGVTGLVTAWVLLDRGYHVTVAAKEWASFTTEKRLTSQIAGALWEYPPAVCGQHTDKISLKKSKQWSMVSYKIWKCIADDHTLATMAGVRMKPSVFFYPGRIDDNPAWLSKMTEIQNRGIDGFRRDPALVHKYDVSSEFGVVDAYEHLAPIIDTDQAMTWLMTMVRSKGAHFEAETFTGDLFHQEEELCKRFGVKAIVNATGLGSQELASDESCYPIRGGLIRVINNGQDFPKLDAALTISAGAIHNSTDFLFILPRNDDILLLGGIAQSREWNLDLTLESPAIQEMRSRCEAFLPELKNARPDNTYPLAQGLRPFRQRNVRVERELRCSQWLEGNEWKRKPSRIVHSYGQGGAGWSLSFGCAEEVASLVDNVLERLPARRMAA